MINVEVAYFLYRIYALLTIIKYRTSANKWTNILNIAIIPARGGSKRIPRKNLRNFCGKPIIAWSIDAALTSSRFDSVIVSTDDEEIAEYAIAQGASVPFFRPSHLADDFTTTRAVVNHALNWLEDNNQRPDYCCVLYATAPFVTPIDLTNAFNQLKKSDKNFCFTATTFSFPIQRAFYFDAHGDIEMFNKQDLTARSQDLVEAYHDAGQFYWGKASAFLNNLPMYSHFSTAYLMPRYRVQDIDTEEDWEMAQLLFNAMRTPETNDKQ